MPAKRNRKGDIIKGRGSELTTTQEEFLERIRAEGMDASSTTSVVHCHGDFWLGNILQDKWGRGLLVVDWERTDRYSLLHDAFTLLAVYCLEQNDFASLAEIVLRRMCLDCFSPKKERINSVISFRCCEVSFFFAKN